jgi:hypothetical protein
MTQKLSLLSQILLRREMHGPLRANSGHYEPGMLACNLKLSVGGVLIGLYLRLDTYDWQNLSMH